MRRQLGRFGLSLVLALVLGPGSTGAQRASESNELDRMRSERRLALVIGNGAYGPRIGPLTNPANDARDIAATLEDLGFAVALELDADRDRMRRAVIDFGLALRDGGIGLFYYSGHAVQLDGVNYLIPLGAEVASESYMPVETVPVDEVLARMGGADNRLNIVILDSCRNNPFKGIFRSASRGLALTPAPTGTYIAYAAAPDALALDGMGSRNSPYTAALLEALEEPGLTLEGVFKRVGSRVLETTSRFQTPWTGSSITGDFFFRLPEPAPAADPQMTAPAPAPAASAPMIDMAVWSAIKDSQDSADFGTFLETYPDSPLAPFARNRLKALQAARTASLPPPEPDAAAPEPSAAAAQPKPAAGTAPPTSAVAALPPAPEPPARQPAPVAPQPDPAVVEAALGLSREQRQEIQVALTALGHDTRGADGLLGRNSRAALSNWQQAAGEPATGYLTAAQQVALLDAAKSALAEWRQRPQPGREFRDCPDCPLMAVVPAGSFLMGSPAAELGRNHDEGPQHTVTIRQPFAVGKYEVTFAEWDACVAAGGCNRYRPNDRGWGRDRRPVINVSWKDAKAYVAWLSGWTGNPYRLLSEAEWEYAARAGTRTPYHTGARINATQANYDGRVTDRSGDRYRRKTLQVQSFEANAWALHDMHGNVYEWAEDCWNGSYNGAPDDGSAWVRGTCRLRIARGGSWNSTTSGLRVTYRNRFAEDVRIYDVGFRVARTLP